MASIRAAERSVSEPVQKALQLATREFDRWLRNDERSAVALRVLGTVAQQRERLLARVRSVIEHERPAAATCQWISENIGAWAPLELLFPVFDHVNTPGISGELSLHRKNLVERVYGHVLADSGDHEVTYALLHADAQRMDLEIAAGRAMCALFDENDANDTFWVEEMRAMQLAMAEYLHRHAIGLKPVLTDAQLTNYTGRIGRIHRNLRERYAPIPLHVQRALAAGSA